MCMGGSSGPSSAELAAQSAAAKTAADAETAKIKAQQDADKALEDAKIVQQQKDAADLDLGRRQRNRTLLSGIALEEESTNPLEDPDAKSEKKAKRSTLLAAV